MRSTFAAGAGFFAGCACVPEEDAGVTGVDFTGAGSAFFGGGVTINSTKLDGNQPTTPFSSPCHHPLGS